MLEKRTSLLPNEAFEELKKIVLKEKCKIIEMHPSKTLVVEQGSWFEFSPKTFRKIIRFDLIPEGTGTRIVSETSWTIGSFASAILTPTLLAILWGLTQWEASIMRSQATTCSTNILAGSANMLELLGFLCIVLTIASIIHHIYCYSKRETVAKRFLSLLPSAKAE